MAAEFKSTKDVPRVVVKITTLWKLYDLIHAGRGADAQEILIELMKPNRSERTKELRRKAYQLYRDGQYTREEYIEISNKINDLVL